MDSNHGENTDKHISKWEFYHYLDYEEPAFRTYGDGYGDIDGWGTEHKKFNKLSGGAKAIAPATGARSLVVPETLTKTMPASDKEALKEQKVAKLDATKEKKVAKLEAHQRDLDHPEQKNETSTKLKKLNTAVNRLEKDENVAAPSQPPSTPSKNFLSKEQVSAHHEAALRHHAKGKGAKKDGKKHKDAKKHHHGSF